MILLRAAVGMVLALALAACDDNKTGPEPIKWDRDGCEMCRMIISDARFAVEVRGGPNRRIYRFDDMGDAVHWLVDKPWADEPGTEIWTADQRKSTRDKMAWIDARAAFYLANQPTPMNYGFGAVGEAEAGAVPFAEMRKIVIERGCNTRCAPETPAKTNDAHKGH